MDMGWAVIVGGMDAGGPEVGARTSRIARSVMPWVRLKHGLKYGISCLTAV